MASKMDRTARIARLVALFVVMGAYPVCAQEGPSPAGDAPQAADNPAAAPAKRDVEPEPLTPQRGPAGLQRRANMKGLVANARGNVAGSPVAGVRTASPALPGIGAAPQRNAVGAVLPGTSSPGRAVAGIAAPAGIRPASVGTPPANFTGLAHPIATHPTAPVPSAGRVLRGAGLNGTTMGHVSSSPGFIGGPAKDHSGINGTSMLPKH